MIRKATMLSLPTLLVIFLTFTGCASSGVTQEQYDAAIAERDSVLAELDAVSAQRDSMAIAADMLRASYEHLQSVFQKEIAANELSLQQLVDGISVRIPSDLLFASGSAEPKAGAESREHFPKLADYLKETNFVISVIGHTDSQRPSARLAQRYPTNWELGGARAARAVRFLEEQGVDPKRMVAVSKGDFEPVDTNDTPEGRSKNRRIQIILRSLPR